MIIFEIRSICSSNIYHFHLFVKNIDIYSFFYINSVVFKFLYILPRIVKDFLKLAHAWSHNRSLTDNRWWKMFCLECYVGYGLNFIQKSGCVETMTLVYIAVWYQCPLIVLSVKKVPVRYEEFSKSVYTWLNFRPHIVWRNKRIIS